MSSGAIRIHRAWLCLSQTIVLFSLMNFTAFCSIGEATWDICGVWDFLLPYCMTPGSTFKTALPVLYLVHTMQTVFLYKTGELSVSGVVTPCQCSTLLLTCFLSPLLVTSFSLTETSGAERKFSWRSRGTKYDTCWMCFASEEGCMGSWDAVPRRLRASCFFSPHPPGFTDVQQLMSLEV